MPAFVKTPRFIISAIVVLWLIYFIFANENLPAISFKLIPFYATPAWPVAHLMFGGFVFGVIVAIAAQQLWRRRSSKPASPYAA
jgi:uncharacterized integral membrane protein